MSLNKWSLYPSPPIMFVIMFFFFGEDGNNTRTLSFGFETNKTTLNGGSGGLQCGLITLSYHMQLEH